MPSQDHRAHLDDVDRRLLELLAVDGRASYAALAPQVDLSAPAVRSRVQRLIDDGVLQVVGVSDPAALGYPVQAMVAITTQGDVRLVADEIGRIENVIYQVLTSGEHDLLAEVVCRTPDELLTVVNDRIRSVPGVLSTRVWQYYGIHTHRYTVGQPDQFDGTSRFDPAGQLGQAGQQGTGSGSLVVLPAPGPR